MKYNKKSVFKGITWLSVPKVIFFVFLLYIEWYKEIWGDVPIILYGSVIVLTASLFIPFENKEHRKLDINSMPLFFHVLLLFGVYCCISGLVVSIQRTVFLSSIKTYFCFLVVLFDCCVIAQRDGSWDWLLRIMFFTALICCVYAIMFGYTIHNGGAIAITLGPYNNPHTLAHVLIIGVFSLVTYRKNGQEKMLLNLFLVMLLSYTIVLTGSRKTLLCICAFFVIWVFSSQKMINRKEKGSLKTLYFVGVILAAALIIWFFFKYYKDSDQFVRLMRLLSDEQESSNENRKLYYLIAVDL